MTPQNPTIVIMPAQNSTNPSAPLPLPGGFVIPEDPVVPVAARQQYREVGTSTRVEVLGVIDGAVHFVDLHYGDGNNLPMAEFLSGFRLLTA